MRVVFDLDGTLALMEHRRHYVDGTGPVKSWPRFFEECDRDTVNTPVAQVALTLLRAGHEVKIWSGRSDIVALKTKSWLRRNKLDDLPIRMRRRDDFRPDHLLKEEWLDEAIAQGKAPDLVFDDRQKVVDMWRRRGIACAQVAVGDF